MSRLFTNSFLVVLSLALACLVYVAGAWPTLLALVVGGLYVFFYETGIYACSVLLQKMTGPETSASRTFVILFGLSAIAVVLALILPTVCVFAAAPYLVPALLDAKGLAVAQLAGFGIFVLQSIMVPIPKS